MSVFKSVFFEYLFNEKKLIIRVECRQSIAKQLKQNHIWLRETSEASPDIQSSIKVSTTLPPITESSILKYGRNIYLSKNQVIWLYQNWLQIRMQRIGGNKIEISATYTTENMFRPLNLLKYIARRQTVEQINRERFLFVTRIVLHFPLFMLLEKLYGLILFHASAVEYNKKAMVFSGFDGAGKSAIALALQKFCGYRLVSDNFCLLDSEGNVYPFIDGMRIDRDVSKALAIDTGKKIYARYEVKNNHQELSYKGFPVVGFFILYRGSHDTLRTIEKQFVIESVSSMHGLLPEFVDYSAFKSLARLIGIPDNNHANKYEAVLNKLPVIGLETSSLLNLEKLTKEIHGHIF